jgi:Domain of unknown function DUF302
MRPPPRQASAAGRSGIRGHVMERDVEEVWYRAARLTLPIPALREFQSRYEAAVPDLPLAAVEDLVSHGAPWSEMVELIERTAPHGFLTDFRNDVHPVMALGGDRADCVAYLMGNHIVAERMFRHDPRAMMYAPLHTVIWEDHDGKAWFTVDQPSAQFGASGSPRSPKWASSSTTSWRAGWRRWPCPFPTG